MNHSINSKLWLGLGLALLAGSAACEKKPEISDSIGVVTKEELVQRVTVNGNVLPWKRSVVAAPYAGYVQKLFVKVGDKVKEGDPIVSVEPLLKTVGERSFPLRSPLSGTVVQTLKLEGEAVDPTGAATATASSLGGAASLVRIDDLSRLVVQANVAETDVEKMREGQEAIIKASAVPEHPYKGIIRTIFRASKENNGWDSARVEYPVFIEVLDKDAQLLSGMSVLVDVISQKVPNALALNLEYIEKKDDGFFVTLENGEKRKVKVGLQNDEAAEILSGLKEGDRIRQVDFLAIAGAHRPRS